MGDLDPLAGTPSQRLTLERAKGMVVPLSQANELEEVTRFIEKNTQPREAVFMFPEIGAYNFIVDRPFVGRFPVGTLTWFSRSWHHELLAALKEQKPRYAVLTKNLPEHFETIYFQKAASKKYYEDVVGFIRENYHVAAETADSTIYKLNEVVKAEQ